MRNKSRIAMSLMASKSWLNETFPCPGVWHHRCVSTKQTQAEAVAAIAHLNLDRSRVKAPFDGAVADRIASAGDYLKTGTPLFRRHPAGRAAFAAAGWSLLFTDGWETRRSAAHFHCPGNVREITDCRLNGRFAATGSGIRPKWNDQPAARLAKGFVPWLQSLVQFRRNFAGDIRGFCLLSLPVPPRI